MNHATRSDRGATRDPRFLVAVGLLSTAMLGSCTDVPTSLATRISGALTAPTSAVEAPRGCTRFAFRLHGRDSIVVEGAPPGALEWNCGTVRPVIAGTPQFDRARQLVRLPVAMRNTGARAVRAPARVFAWADSSVVTAPSGLGAHPRQTTVDFLGADSLRAPDAAAFRGAELWLFDTLLTSAGDPPRLATGEQSLVRWIELSVHPGVLAFETVLWAEAEPVALSWPVPETPTPTTDSVWTAVAAPDNIVDGDVGRWVWNALYVRFNEGTARNVKQTLFDSIGAHAVGGFTLGRGEFYLVTLDSWAVTTRDNALGRLFGLADGLSAHPAVSGVRTIDLTPLEVHSLLPKDAGDFANWATRREEADDQNWGLEAIDAPLAWGCDVGARAPRIAVVDRDFRSHSEIDYPNARVRDFGKSMDSIPGHGSRMASILGARGNNQDGMTGVLWNTPLELYDIGVSGPPGADPTTYPYFRIAAAVRDAAKIINLSLGLVSFPDSVIPTKANPEHVRKVKDAHTTLESVFIDWEINAHDPLIVVATGNRPLSLYWTGWQILAESSFTKSRLMVVGAVERDGREVRLANFSGRDPLVNIAAPGVDVGSIGPNGGIVTGSGTSFAAPYVSGVAGLLRSFDPTLTADSTRKLILAGARKGGRTVAGDRPIPVLDAYGALQAAAEAKGTRLCGNRVWHDGAKVTASRGSETEILFTDGAPDPEYLNVHHGGSTIDLDFSRRYTRISAGNWSAVPYQSLPRDSSGGSFWGALGISHNFDRQVVVSTAGDYIDARLHSATGEVAATKFAVGASSSGYMACTVRHAQTEGFVNPRLVGYRCADSTFVGTTQSAAWPIAALSPDARYALIAVPMESHTHAVTGESVCPGWETAQFPSYCSTGTTISSTLTTRVFRVSMVSGGEWKLIHEVQGEVGWVSVSEDESEFAFSSGKRTQSSSWSYIAWGRRTVVGPRVCSDYGVSYLSLPPLGDSTSPTLLGRYPYSNSAGCARSQLVTGGFSSSRAPDALVKP